MLNLNSSTAPKFTLEKRAVFSEGRRGVRPPAEWHISQTNDDGAIMVSNQAVERKYRNPKRYGDRVNLAQFCGTQIGLKKSAIIQILGGHARDVFDRLVENGLIKIHCETKRNIGLYYCFDPGWSFRDIYNNWVDLELERPESYRDFSRHKMLRWACRIPADDPIPEIIFEAAVEKLAQLGTTEISEINGFLPIGDCVVERTTEVRRAINIYWRARASTDLPFVDDDVVLATFPELGSARDTSLMKHLRHERPSPPPEALSRAWVLGPLRKPLILLLYIAAAKGAQRDALFNFVRAFELVDRHFQVVAPLGTADNANVIEFVLGTFAFGDLQEKVAIGPREEAARSFMIGVMWLNRWVKYSQDNAFDQFICAKLRDRSHFLKQLKEVYGHIRPLGRAKRLKRAAKAAERFVQLQEIAYSRKESICDTAATARRAISQMGDAPYIKFSVYDRVMGPDGSLMSGAQRNDWIAWRRSNAGSVLPDIPANPTELNDGFNVARERCDSSNEAANVDLSSYIFEFVGCAPVVGVDSYDPWYITCAEHATWVAPALLDPEMQEARHKLVRDWHLPFYPSTPSGLLRFGLSDSALFRRMAAKQRTIFPLGQFEMAMRFAHLSLRAVVESFCRSGEFRQMEHRVSRWPTKPSGDDTLFYFTAFRKAGAGDGQPVKRDLFQVSEQTHDEAFELAEAVIAHCHGEIGNLPDIDPPNRLDWKCDRGPYIFSWAGKPLQLSVLLVFLRYLLANTGEQFGFHDFRHAAAKDAKMIGLPMILISDALKHSFSQITEYYASLTPQLIADRSNDDLARRRAEQSRRATYRNVA